MPRHLAAKACHLLLVLRGFDEDDVRPQLGEARCPGDRLIQAVGRPGIGAGQDADVQPEFLARLGRRPYAHQGLGAVDDRLAGRMAAALRPDLVLDHGAGEPRLRIAADGASDIDGIAVPGIGVAEHRQVRRLADVASLVHDLAVGDQPRVRHAQTGGRDRESAHEGGIEPRRLGP